MIDKGDLEQISKDGMENVEKALKLDPNHYDAWMNKGCIYQCLGNLNEADSCFVKAIEIDPDCARAYNDRANIMAEWDDNEAAAFEYLNALERDPMNSRTLCNLGMCLQFTDYKDPFANIALNEAFESSPDDTFIAENYLIYLIDTE